MPVFHLADRRIVRISGPDAEKLLQDVITPDLDRLSAEDAVPGALLTPQGKILFDFLIARDGADAFLIDIDGALLADFIKRMTLYKLRARVTIAADETLQVAAEWDETPIQAYDLAGRRRDRRFQAPVHRIYGTAPFASTASGEDYDALRIATGVAQSGADYALSDAFPHDVLMDLNGGVSFRKGCFVGQEVVSRMQHRGTARRRLALASAETALPASGTALVADGKPVGVLGTVVGDRSLALVRTDRAANAMAKGAAIEAEGVPVALTLHEWTGLSFQPAPDEG